MVQGIISGGPQAMFRSVEAAEDSAPAGSEAMDEKNVGPNDVVFGIATGGTTPFVHGALQRARERGAKTVFLACVPVDQCEDGADVSIRVLTGPEVITGSTRLKAGTATKLVLNTVTTLSMVQMGKVYGNLMVDVNAYACSKLVDRAARIISQATGLDRSKALELLDRASGSVKTAIVMHHRNIDAQSADTLLDEHHRNVRSVLES
jgi:N-acetylmuramic acid 6-phosphate etherase